MEKRKKWERKTEKERNIDKHREGRRNEMYKEIKGDDIRENLNKKLSKQT